MNSPNPSPRSKASTSSSLKTFLKGLMSGLVLGVALCAGVALYVTRLPTPFVAHVAPSTTAPEHLPGEGRDSNADHGLMGPSSEGTSATAAAPHPTGDSPATPPTTLPTLDATHASTTALTPVPEARPTESGPNASTGHNNAPASKSKGSIGPTEESGNGTNPWFVQTGAFGNESDAENQRAHLALLGLDATVLAPEAGEKPLYRVRMGPLSSIDEVRTLVATLKNNDIPTSISRGNSLKAH